MPRKVRAPANVAQNRENQQRSRARRREYLASLEARVRDLESREVQATLAMQRAAQEVAWVNERLVELLATRGVAREEVDEFLRARAEGGGTANRGSGGVRSEKEDERGGSEVRESDINERSATGMGVGMSISESAVDGQRVNVCDGESQILERSADNALVTSCDDAASIIADFHGHGDVSHARRVLGCGSATNCHVKNTRLFQLMDEAGGL